MNGKKYTDPSIKVPKEYHDFLDVFSKPSLDTLLPHREGLDHEIRLTTEDEHKLPYKKTYGMT